MVFGICTFLHICIALLAHCFEHVFIYFSLTGHACSFWGRPGTAFTYTHDSCWPGYFVPFVSFCDRPLLSASPHLSPLYHLHLVPSLSYYSLSLSHCIPFYHLPFHSLSYLLITLPASLVIPCPFSISPSLSLFSCSLLGLLHHFSSLACHCATCLPGCAIFFLPPPLPPCACLLSSIHTCPPAYLPYAFFCLYLPLPCYLPSGAFSLYLCTCLAFSSFSLPPPVLMPACYHIPTTPAMSSFYCLTLPTIV